MENQEIKSELVKGIKNHPFSYGFSEALSQPDSQIRKQNGEYTLFYRPASVNDSLWFGDCASDALLTVKALDEISESDVVRAESLQFNFDDVSFSATHYRVYYGSENEPMDHSSFYANLNMSYSIKEKIVIDPDLVLIDNIDLQAKNRNFSEFSLSDKLYLSTFSVGEIQDHEGQLLVQSCIFEQDSNGIVTKRIEFNCFIPKSLKEPMEEKQVREKFVFHTAHITQKDRSGFEEFNDGLIKDQTVLCVTKVINAIARGNTAT